MSVTTSNMGLQKPTIGTDSGLAWEQAMNANSTIIDAHNHASGSGNPITSAAININSDLNFNGTNILNPRSVRFLSQQSTLNGASDLRCIYAVGSDLYYNNAAGFAIQITTGNTVNATSSGISSGTASASFVSSILTVLSAANTPASIRGGSYLMGNTGTSGSNYLTLSPPSALSANYGITLPLLPPSTSVVTLDSSGNLAASVPVTQALNPTGVVLPYSGATAPSGYLLCDGSAVSRSTYATLFALYNSIGLPYGSGNGSTTFNVPNLTNSAPFGTGSRFTIGQTGGYLDPTLNTLVSHSHTDTGHVHSMGTGGNSSGGSTSPTGNTSIVNNTATTSTSFANITSAGLSSINGNMPPFIGMTYIVKT